MASTLEEDRFPFAPLLAIVLILAGIVLLLGVGTLEGMFGATILDEVVGVTVAVAGVLLFVRELT